APPAPSQRTGSPAVTEKLSFGTAIHATAGAPAERRQSSQWHNPWRVGSSTAAWWRTAPQRHPPVSMIRLLPDSATEHSGDINEVRLVNAFQVPLLRVRSCVDGCMAASSVSKAAAITPA